ncbi:acyl-CoA thioesterase-2 [Caulobacter ginsengisoli]|uniref:Acyl-CoA thioesterase-2 n=1 Tax=Caulobacter ginsengisoli TaxID=400775 RepID=A0ABU0IUH7_9CAUL|nr:acyl-CoA thioesterase II [Caulobacter ginsengisoli]MDQ0465666.1 acyl-CoA thioesterase-2 [Caulobacter ginsengisoli]
MEETENLIETLALEPIEMNLFRGVSPNDGFPRIFGGFVIAQALLAAYETVEDRVCHSLHAYFIRPGDVRIPVLYEVDRSRDGGSFTTRRVIAIQNGKQIFNLAASFQVQEEGLEHQFPMPAAPSPEDILTEWDRALADNSKLPPQMIEHMKRRPVDVRWPDPQDIFNPVPKPPRKQVWMRSKAPIGDNIKLQQAALAYASDMAFMETALRVHGLTWQTPGLQSASLDHAMWFHRPSDFHDWILFDQDCPSTSQGRGFLRGEMYSRDGRLLASVAQECLMRVKD